MFFLSFDLGFMLPAAKDAIAIQETPEENELSEEELIVILTAAAVEALGGMDAKRFRVVAFRRL